ncbi:class I SAM-dependent methyltransferase [Thetidibacter halocola]|uniref:Class I SAM-dependent methyltransferase n=1 Tax=Thetidibacter halocola TaxID=2827239 RepID=A0A8J8B9K2_9RHOB|nr:class I SAM-dependent methyltransferase [Thetidibacter halocola]MBS0124278.1 class I SAM-dependent methyltransferase [Thetidibacter halocola]
MSDPGHWDRAYARSAEALSWFEADPVRSLALLDRAGLRPGQAVVDVGGGASLLVDALLARGLGPVTVLDLSPVALATSQSRLGPLAERVDWIAGDVTAWRPEPGGYALWHDRAVFHFLTTAAGQAAYAAVLHRALAPGGAAVVATFAPDGPERCSGLPVQRWSSEDLAQALGLRLDHAERFVHVTPSGNEQRFQMALMRKEGEDG